MRRERNQAPSPGTPQPVPTHPPIVPPEPAQPQTPPTPLPGLDHPPPIPNDPQAASGARDE